MNTTTDHHTLYYIHDPMCSWCWGFRPALQELTAALPETISLQYLLGGLAPDTMEPMPESMQHTLQQTWKDIQHEIPGTEFNFNFWSACKPRRSTYPASRAVIAAGQQNHAAARSMILAIQEAYYLNAQNPSDEITLIQLAQQLGLDPRRFRSDLHSKATQTMLENEIQLSRKLGGNSFPSLILKIRSQLHQLPVDYHNATTMLQLIESLIKNQVQI